MLRGYFFFLIPQFSNVEPSSCIRELVINSEWNYKRPAGEILETVQSLMQSATLRSRHKRRGCCKYVMKIAGEKVEPH
jgi:hypothetical protein